VSEDFSEAVQIAREQAQDDGEEEVCVIGGAEIFAMALAKARRMYLTEVAASPEGDVVFPSFDEADWSAGEQPCSAGRDCAAVLGSVHDAARRVAVAFGHRGQALCATAWPDCGRDGGMVLSNQGMVTRGFVRRRRRASRRRRGSWR
jgi:hypothetical protein